MLNGEDIVVTANAEGGDKFAPPLTTVSVAAGAKEPAALAHLRVRFRIEYAGQREILRVELSVLRVNVEDGVAEQEYSGEGVDILPEEVARIKVAADGWTRERS